MKILGLRSIIVRKYNNAGKSTIDNIKEYPIHLEQDFFADVPNQKWVGDITYIYKRKRMDISSDSNGFI
ncbi:MAG: hypothetical protein IJO32_01160 [Bacilli bacterium]|nr:hypothetical protein [Bacilli bacterium]